MEPLPLRDPATRPQTALAQRYARVRGASLALAAPLSAEDCQVQSMPDASPTKWHLAHITWFFETFVLARHAPQAPVFDPAFKVLFNSYYQGVGAQHPRALRGLVTRPSLADVKRYRAHVDEHMLGLLEARAGDAALAEIVELGLQHEQQHQELLLTDIKHALSHSPGSGGYARRWPIAAVRPQPLRWIGYAGGRVEHGHDASLDGAFCFDNETPRHSVWLAPFELASRPVTYGEFIEFIDDAGYRRPELWLSMGWDWVNAHASPRSCPLYWQRRDERWFNHTLQGVVEVDPRTPHFAERGAFHPLPHADSASAPDEPVQMFGDVWEWTQSNYNAYPGYRPLPGAVGEYNGKFMCNQLVLRGGSCATPAGHVRASYRNFFPPDAQWQFSGLRLAR